MKHEYTNNTFILEWGNFQQWSQCSASCGNQTATRVSTHYPYVELDILFIEQHEFVTDANAGMSESWENCGCQKL